MFDRVLNTHLLQQILNSFGLPRSITLKKDDVIDNLDLGKVRSSHPEGGKVKHKLQVTSSNTRVASSNLRVTSSNPRVRRLKARVRRLKARVQAMKPRVK